MEDSDSKVQMEGKLAPNRAGAEDILSPKSLGMMELGISIIQEVVKTLPSSPGVYQMLNEQGEALYVGKARSLKNVCQPIPDLHNFQTDCAEWFPKPG